ncbi:MAG: peptidoglycan-binding protein, partial [Clostridiales bacterium]|nr:peptidoglycan-binding protein [Clostridiales bacterium]
PIFQNEFVLTPDGIVGRRTWAELARVYGTVRGQQAELFEYPGFVLRMGTRGGEVRLMQLVLNELSNYYPQIPLSAVDGIFGAQFYGAVIAFQRLFGLPVDGMIGPLTWSRIVYERSRAANRDTNNG